MPGFPNDQSNPAAATPVWIASQPSAGGFIPFMDAPFIEAATPAVDLINDNPTRRYLFIQGQDNTATVYFSFASEPPGPGGIGVYTIPPGGSYESGTVVPTGPISFAVSLDCYVTVVEG